MRERKKGREQKRERNIERKRERSEPGASEVPASPRKPRVRVSGAGGEFDPSDPLSETCSYYVSKNRLKKAILY